MLAHIFLKRAWRVSMVDYTGTSIISHFTRFVFGVQKYQIIITLITYSADQKSTKQYDTVPFSAMNTLFSTKNEDSKNDT